MTKAIDLTGVAHFNGTLYVRDEQEWFTGYRKLAIPTQAPSFQWRGPRMRISEWRKAMCFMLRVNKETQSEAQLRAFVLNGEIVCWAFPQKKNSGMTTKEISGPEKDAQMSEITSRGGEQIMTIHSHCNSSAFQSGTDKADENSVDGLHITMGKLNSVDEYDIHGRIYYDGCEYQAGAWHSWFDLELEPSLQEQLKALVGINMATLTKMALCAPIPESVYMAKDAFPQQWWDNLIPDTVVTYAVSKYPQNQPSQWHAAAPLITFKGLSRIKRIPGKGLNESERFTILSLAGEIYGSFPQMTMERLLGTLKRKGGPAQEDIFKDDYGAFIAKLSAWGYSKPDAVAALSQTLYPEQRSQRSSTAPHRTGHFPGMDPDMMEEAAWEAMYMQSMGGGLPE